MEFLSENEKLKVSITFSGEKEELLVLGHHLWPNKNQFLSMILKIAKASIECLKIWDMYGEDKPDLVCI